MSLPQRYPITRHRLCPCLGCRSWPPYLYKLLTSVTINCPPNPPPLSPQLWEAASEVAPDDPRLPVFMPCTIPSSGVWARPSDSLQAENGKRDGCHFGIRLQKDYDLCLAGLLSVSYSLSFLEGSHAVSCLVERPTWPGTDVSGQQWTRTWGLPASMPVSLEERPPWLVWDDCSSGQYLT